jgi:hypothetical protein
MSVHWVSAKSDISIYTNLGSKPVDRQARQVATGNIEDPQSRKARNPLNGQIFSQLDFSFDSRSSLFPLRSSFEIEKTGILNSSMYSGKSSFSGLDIDPQGISSRQRIPRGSRAYVKKLHRIHVSVKNSVFVSSSYRSAKPCRANIPPARRHDQTKHATGLRRLRLRERPEQMSRHDPVSIPRSE